MPSNKIFIRCRKCKKILVAVSLRNEVSDGIKKDISDEVMVQMSGKFDPICNNCRYPKESCSVVDDIKNIFKGVF